MTDAEHKVFIKGVAAGAITGLAVGLITALFIALRPEVLAPFIR